MGYRPGHMAESAGSFSLGSFLLERLPSISGMLVAFLIATIIMIIVGTPTDAIIIIDVVAAIAVVSSLAFEFIREARFWNELRFYSESLSSTLHFSELCPEPRFQTQRIAADAAHRVADMANSNISSLRSDAIESNRYIELWVHETKTPLAAARLISGRIDDRQVANEILAELERLDSQVTQALFAARATMLENDYAIREVPLSQLVSEACKQNMHLLIERGITIGIDIGEGISVLSDPSWMSFIITQVITNSAKYDATRIEFSAKEVGAESPDASTMLSIADDGCGIPAHDAPRIFERGFIGEVGRAHGSATGMGLYLIADMCERMGLGLEVSSEEGVGTVVSISFPHDRRRAIADSSKGMAQGGKGLGSSFWEGSE